MPKAFFVILCDSMCRCNIDLPCEHACGCRAARLVSSPLAQLVTYEGHSGNVTELGFQRTRKWMYTGSDDGTLKIWDLRCA